MAAELGKASFQAVFEDQGVVKGLKGIDSQADNTVSKAGGAFSNLGNIAKTALGVVSVGAIAAVGTSLVNMSMDFEVSMAKINTLLSDDTNLKQYEQTIIDFSKKTGLSIENLSDGMYQTISSIGDLGDETEQIFQTMGTSAKAGGAEMSDAVALISSAMKGYGTVNDDTAKKISDLAFTTAKLGVTTFPELAKSMQPLFPLGDSLNFSYEELFGTMATLTGVTGNTSEVTTQLKAVMSGLISPTKGMEKLMGKYGYANGQAMIESEGLTGMLQILQEETGGQSDKMAELFGSTEALTAITALSGSQFDTFKEKLGEMENASGATDSAYEKMSNTLRDKLDVTMNNVKVSAMGFADSLLEKVSPSLIAVLDNVNGLMNGTKSMSDVLDDAYAESFNFIEALPSILETGSKKMIEGIENITGSILELAPQFMRVAMGFIENLVIGIVNTAPTLTATFVGSIGDLLTSATLALPDIFNFGVDIVTMLIDGIIANGFAFQEQGYMAIEGILNGLLSAIPDLLVGLGTVFEYAFVAIEANLPTFLENGKNFVFNMVDGILESLPNIIDSAVVLLEQFIATTVENLPSIIKTGVEFALSFVSGILERLPDLVASAVTLVGKFAWTILLNLPQVLAAGCDILWTVVDGIMSLFYKIPEVGGQIIKGLWTGMGNLASWMFEKVANFLPKNIAEPIRNFIPKLFDVGGDIVRGIWNGITNMGGWLWEKVSGFVSDKIMSPVKNFFGIKSPSRTMRDEVGKMIPQGLAIGIEAESDTAISAMDDLSASLIAEPVKISSPENLKSLYGTNSDNVSRETSQETQVMRPLILQIDGKEFARTVINVTDKDSRKKILLGGV